jgi:hypothetical protein
MEKKVLGKIDAIRRSKRKQDYYKGCFPRGMYVEV